MRHAIQAHDGTPLQTWLKRHGARTVAKYKELEISGGVGPISFRNHSPDKFEAFIDEDNNFAPEDKFSQVVVSVLHSQLFYE